VYHQNIRMDAHNTYSARLILGCWILWLVTGTYFYAIIDSLGWSKGFYMAVNVGYSIGWGYPVEKETWMDWFSIVFLLFGAAAVAVVLVSLAEDTTRNRRDWFVQVLHEEKWIIRKEQEKRWFRYWIHENKFHLLALAYWFAFIAVMAGWSCYAVGWTMVEGLYFAISSCSTGGLKPIPTDSPNSSFVIGKCILSGIMLIRKRINVLKWAVCNAAGAFSAVGIPLMGYAMVHGALLFRLVTKDPLNLEKIIDKELTPMELRTFLALGIGRDSRQSQYPHSSYQYQQEHNNNMTKSEYTILCTIRLGLLSPQLVLTLGQHFDTIDKEGAGAVAYERLLTPNISSEFTTIPLTNSDERTYPRGLMSSGVRYGSIDTNAITSALDDDYEYDFEEKQQDRGTTVSPLRSLYLSITNANDVTRAPNRVSTGPTNPTSTSTSVALTPQSRPTPPLTSSSVGNARSSNPSSMATPNSNLALLSPQAADSNHNNSNYTLRTISSGDSDTVSPRDPTAVPLLNFLSDLVSNFTGNASVRPQSQQSQQGGDIASPGSLLATATATTPYSIATDDDIDVNITDMF
jgi:hypothetical protein